MATNPRPRRKVTRPDRERPTAPGPIGPTGIDSFVARTAVAYFTMELAIRPEMHTYCGGLGLLAGDTARSSADLGIPMVFVTMISRAGYFWQEIDPKGRQVERPDRWNPQDWCERLAPVVNVEIEGRSVAVQPWLSVVTGVDGFQNPILLLDTDLDPNSKSDRTMSDELYGGTPAYRLKQEVVLGIGGLRALRALGIRTPVYHLNEGHASLLTLELLAGSGTASKELPTGELPARISDVRSQCVFTTHSPVEAAHDRFDYDLVERILRPRLGRTQLQELGGKDRLDMTRLGMNLSGYVNGVSIRNAETTRQMFPGYTIHAVTNGVHPPTWTHPAFAELFDAKIPRWRREPELLVRACGLGDDEVWERHLVAKRELLKRLQATAGVEFDAGVLTMVFARRMVGWKRPLLLFEDPGRLADIAAHHRLQVVFTGKAHPLDGAGKELIRRLNEFIHELEGKVPCVFLPNYNMDLAKSLVAGADVWYQNPLPPMEASGTSGMKAALNGGLNVSTLDGWWEEGCIDGVNGWSIPHSDGEDTDRKDAAAVYEMLETAILPCYYQDAPRWRLMMKQSIGHVGSYFSSHRMLRQYAVEAYLRSTLPGTSGGTAG